MENKSYSSITLEHILAEPYLMDAALTPSAMRLSLNFSKPCDFSSSMCFFSGCYRRQRFNRLLWKFACGKQ